MEKEISKDNNNVRLCGLLLAGGYSTRMGQDKAFIQYKGKPVYQHLAQTLDCVCAEVKISCRQEQEALFSDYTTIIDAFPSSGPLTGLLSAFMDDPRNSKLVAPVDMPYLTVDFLRKYLISQRDVFADATIIMDQRTDTLHPLVGIYETSSYSTISQQFQKGQYSVKKILNMLRVNVVSFTEDQNVLANFNSPSDWQ